MQDREKSARALLKLKPEDESAIDPKTWFDQGQSENQICNLSSYTIFEKAWIEKSPTSFHYAGPSSASQLLLHVPLCTADQQLEIGTLEYETACTDHLARATKRFPNVDPNAIQVIADLQTRLKITNRRLEATKAELRTATNQVLIEKADCQHLVKERDEAFEHVQALQQHIPWSVECAIIKELGHRPKYPRRPPGANFAQSVAPQTSDTGGPVSSRRRQHHFETSNDHSSDVGVHHAAPIGSEVCIKQGK